MDIVVKRKESHILPSRLYTSSQKVKTGNIFMETDAFLFKKKNKRHASLTFKRVLHNRFYIKSVTNPYSSHTKIQSNHSVKVVTCRWEKRDFCFCFFPTAHQIEHYYLKSIKNSTPSLPHPNTHRHTQNQLAT